MLLYICLVTFLSLMNQILKHIMVPRKNREAPITYYSTLRYLSSYRRMEVRVSGNTIKIIVFLVCSSILSGCACVFGHQLDLDYAVTNKDKFNQLPCGYEYIGMRGVICGSGIIRTTFQKLVSKIIKSPNFVIVL